VTRSTSVRPRLWLGLFGLVTVLLLVAPRLAAPVVTRGWALLAALAVASVLLAAVRGEDADRRILAPLGAVLPPRDRAAWRAEVAAVLAYAEEPAERRRQALGFALALPATALCCWRLRWPRPVREH
jgi:hypothetical protein